MKFILSHLNFDFCQLALNCFFAYDRFCVFINLTFWNNSRRQAFYGFTFSVNLLLFYRFFCLYLKNVESVFLTVSWFLMFFYTAMLAFCSAVFAISQYEFPFWSMQKIYKYQIIFIRFFYNLFVVKRLKFKSKLGWSSKIYDVIEKCIQPSMAQGRNIWEPI